MHNTNEALDKALAALGYKRWPGDLARLMAMAAINDPKHAFCKGFYSVALYIQTEVALADPAKQIFTGVCEVRDIAPDMREENLIDKTCSRLSIDRLYCLDDLALDLEPFGNCKTALEARSIARRLAKRWQTRSIESVYTLGPQGLTHTQRIFCPNGVDEVSHSSNALLN